MTSTKSELLLWVRAEPFDLGLVQVPPSPKLTFQSVQKISTYVKTKVRSSHPDLLSFATWKHLAVNKLHYSEEDAWAFFELYDVLTDVPAADRLKWLEEFANCKSDEECEQVRRRTSVSLPRFLLFLVTQLSSRISLRSTLLTGDHAARSATSSITGANSKETEEHVHLQFVMLHLPQILEVLAERDCYTAAATSVMEHALSLKALQALDFLLAGTADGIEVVGIDKLALRQSQALQAGYSKITGTFALTKLQAWIFSLLGQNPFGVEACIAQRRRRLSGGASPAAAAHLVPLSLGKSANNKDYAPASHHLVLFTQVSHQTLMRTEADVGGCGVVLKRSHYSHIYLLAPLRFVRIERCRHSTFVLGAVRGVVRLLRCEDCTVISACHRIQLRQERRVVQMCFNEFLVVFNVGQSASLLVLCDMAVLCLYKLSVIFYARSNLVSVNFNEFLAGFNEIILVNILSFSSQ